MPLNWIQWKILNGLDVVEIHVKKICNIIWSISQHVMCYIFQDKTHMKLFHLLWMVHPWFLISLASIFYKSSFFLSSIYHPKISSIHGHMAKYSIPCQKRFHQCLHDIPKNIRLDSLVGTHVHRLTR
jgi:hypothetical protein